MVNLLQHLFFLSRLGLYGLKRSRWQSNGHVLFKRSQNSGHQDVKLFKKKEKQERKSVTALSPQMPCKLMLVQTGSHTSVNPTSDWCVNRTNTVHLPTLFQQIGRSVTGRMDSPAIALGRRWPFGRPASFLFC